MCSGALAEERSDSRVVPEQIKSDYLPYLGVIEQLAILCATDSTLSATEAQKFWDVASKKRNTVEWVSERFNDDLIPILAIDYDSASNEKGYFEQIKSRGGCNKSLLSELDLEIENVKSFIRRDDPVIVTDAPWWMMLIGLAMLTVLMKASEFLYGLFGGKRD